MHRLTSKIFWRENEVMTCALSLRVSTSPFETNDPQTSISILKSKKMLLCWKRICSPALAGTSGESPRLSRRAESVH